MANSMIVCHFCASMREFGECWITASYSMVCKLAAVNFVVVFFWFKKFIHPFIYFSIQKGMRIKILWALSIGESRWSCRISTSKRQLRSIWFMDNHKKQRERDVVHMLFYCLCCTWIQIGWLTRWWVQMTHDTKMKVTLFSPP